MEMQKDQLIFEQRVASWFKRRKVAEGVNMGLTAISRAKPVRCLVRSFVMRIVRFRVEVLVAVDQSAPGSASCSIGA